MSDHPVERSPAEDETPASPSEREAQGRINTAIENSKFDLGAPPPRFDTGELPWCYGDDRITALVRSPDALYLYWEITDEGIADARRRLGPAGAWAWCTLRIYDTTGKDFDGTNANHYFDLRVERTDRDYFLSLNRPGATVQVEIGMHSHEGYFQPIARSGRADFPRKSPSPNHSLEWMTVTSDDSHPAAVPTTSKYTGPPPGSWRGEEPGHPGHHHGEPAHGEGAPGESRWVESFESRSWTWIHPEATEVRWEGPWLFDNWQTEWRTRWFGAFTGRTEGAWHLTTTFGAHGPVELSEWRIGPFPIHLFDVERVKIEMLGGGHTWLEEPTTGLQVFGPWQVVIRSFDAEPQRRVLGTWRVHWVRVSPPRVERWWTAIERRRTGAWLTQHVVAGASEAHVHVAGGASDVWRVGASERWMLGASEWLAQGGSEVLWIGASETAFAGASALLYAGASGALWGGASEWRTAGASEWFAAGASAWLAAGASERMGASEWLALGASEQWLGGASGSWTFAGGSELTSSGLGRGVEEEG